MVAKITTPKSIVAALNYNEKKVQQENAVCLYAGKYLNEAKNMNFYQKLHGFERLNDLNDRATTKTLHVSLNFDPSEKISDNRLVDIASVYMNKIGFGGQPYLVYKHNDAGHPHIHIVSTTIQENGSRINTHNIGRNQSEKARKEIEQLYNLVKAERQQQLPNPKIKAVDIEKALYGKVETKRSITNIVTTVFNQYKFSSLPEFNAALRQFNVVADRGKEDGRIYKNRGLVYRILDANGNKVGVPIKASSINCKPTLENLEKKFTMNDPLKQSLQLRTKSAIDDCFLNAPGSMKQLIAALENQQIYTMLRQNTDGRLYGITFVDNQNKCVFNGSDIGKGYSAAALQSRLSNTTTPAVAYKSQNTFHSGKAVDSLQKEMTVSSAQTKSITIPVKNEQLLDLLLSTKGSFDSPAGGLLKTKRKKKKRKDTNF